MVIQRFWVTDELLILWGQAGVFLTHAACLPLDRPPLHLQTEGGKQEQKVTVCWLFGNDAAVPPYNLHHSNICQKQTTLFYYILHRFLSVQFMTLHDYYFLSQANLWAGWQRVVCVPLRGLSEPWLTWIEDIPGVTSGSQSSPAVDTFQSW